MVHVRWLLLAGAAVLTVAIMVSPTAARAVAPGDELPDGEGKKILQASCTSCHDLSEVTKFRGYYTKAQWRDLVITMVEYGADLKQPEVDTLVDYLTQHLGKQ